MLFVLGHWLVRLVGLVRKTPHHVRRHFAGRRDLAQARELTEALLHLAAGDAQAALKAA